MSEKYLTILELCPEENFEEFEPVVMDEGSTYIYCKALVPISMIEENSYCSYYEDDSIEASNKNDNDNDNINENIGEYTNEEKIESCCYIQIKKISTRKLLSLTEMLLSNKFYLKEIYKNRVLNRLYKEAECRERKMVDVKENRMIMYRIDMDFMKKKQQNLVNASKEKIEEKEKIEKVKCTGGTKKIGDLEEIKETEELEKTIGMIDNELVENDKKLELKIGDPNGIELNKNDKNKNCQNNCDNKKQHNYKIIELDTEEYSCTSKDEKHMNCCGIC